MKNTQEVLDFSLTLPETYFERPFKKYDAIAIKHKGNHKWFALIIDYQGRTLVNVKCHPDWTEFWRSRYDDVFPGYHMNKEHWNSIVIGGAVPDDDFKQMIFDSYHLTKEGKNKKPS